MIEIKILIKAFRDHFLPDGTDDLLLQIFFFAEKKIDRSDLVIIDLAFNIFVF